MAKQGTPDVGQRIRAIREQQGHSLRTLAERSGLSLNAISLIERGENSPTVSSLHMLATALGVSISHFFTSRQEQGVVFVRPPDRLCSRADGIMMASLGIGLRHQQLEPFLVRVAAGSGNLDQPMSHAGEEFIYCLEGEIDYCAGKQNFELAPGCSLLFEATIPHGFCNTSRESALLMIVFQSAAGGHLARRLQLELAVREDGNEDIGRSDT